MSTAVIERETSETALPVRLWEENLHGLVTLRHMLEFYARDFFIALESLDSMKREVLSLKTNLAPQRFNAILADLKVLDGHLRHIGLTHSGAQIERIAQALKDGLVDAHRFAMLVTSLEERIDDEMSWRVFFCVEQEYSALFFHCPDPEKSLRLEAKPLQDVYGADIMTLFETEDHDPKEVIRCLVCGRTTGAVFHLMRMLEIGLTPLAAIFNVSMVHTNWGPALEELERAIKNMHKDPMWKVFQDCKDRQEQYAQAVSHFDMLRVAWRNYTAHARGKYTAEEATDIFRNVKGFLGKTARVLARYPNPIGGTIIP